MSSVINMDPWKWLAIHVGIYRSINISIEARSNSITPWLKSLIPALKLPALSSASLDLDELCTPNTKKAAGNLVSHTYQAQSNDWQTKGPNPVVEE